MLARTPTLHCHTPTLKVADPRGLPVRSVGYCRIAQDGPAEVRINRTAHDPAGRAIAQWDPRLFRDASAPANLATIYSLSGKVLSTTSVDAGLRVSLYGEADQLAHGWDGRGSQRWTEYDKLMRPQAVFEQALDEAFSCMERYLYGTADSAFADRNQCGQLIRHDDPAGTRLFKEYGLAAAVLEQVQHFTLVPEAPDWPEDLVERDKSLEPGAGAGTRFHFSPAGEALEQTDAQGNRQLFNYNLAGQLRETHLQLHGSPARRCLVSAIHYNADGHIEQEIAGNGVVSQLHYGAQDGRLIRLWAMSADNEPRQDLNYRYDQVGNVVSIEDKALPVRHFANQRVVPINRYTYDSLYQLIYATGWEAGSNNKGPSSVEDPIARGNYHQTYRYDSGGNLQELIHHGPQRHGRTLTAAKYSNRCLPEQDGRPPTETEIANGFDENGNLLTLAKGRTLSWDLRNQLKDVRSVERDSGPDDSESYIYGGGGRRQRKIGSVHTHVRTTFRDVRYLTGLEARTNSSTRETLFVISVDAGRCRVEVVYRGGESANNVIIDQFSYCFSDHLRSCTLELDSQAKIICRETYHPFGTTAFYSKGDSAEVSYRTRRYSGQEQDITGLYYYGARYYIPELQRWCTADPAGEIDGLNLYCMVTNRPLLYRDGGGLVRALADGMTVQEERSIEQEPSASAYDSNHNVKSTEKPPSSTDIANNNYLDTSPLETPQGKKNIVDPRWTVRSYLDAHVNTPRTLVVGCGASPQGVKSMGGLTAGACSLGSQHEHDFTVDVDADAHPDLTADLITYAGTELGQHGLEQFDEVRFEYISRGPKNRFQELHIQRWIRAADALSKPGGRVLFYNFDSSYRAVAGQELGNLGYSVKSGNISPTGLPENLHGHVFVEGVKKTKGVLGKLSTWLRR